MNTDPIADLLTRIRNGVKAKHTEVTVPYSKVKEQIGKILVQEKFVDACKAVETDGKKNIVITLKPTIKALALNRKSSPGQRIYVQSSDIRRVRNGYGIAIISTNKGIITGKQAKKDKVGGEYICEVYQESYI